ncbi:MAG: single-stranded-DNA-specific exonuclease RecJ [Candidatus Cloacimonadota bacterium]|nr:MAG: single-stranded-DNA-specific exonuclease RecJ [Candidatus Cloacimonadota bacterium]
MKKKWQYADSLTPEEIKLREEIVQTYKCPSIIAELLIKKGNKSLDGINSFFDPKMKDTHDPFIFKDMKKAVNRIISAIENKEKIIIFGDYDVDGTTSTALLYLGLKKCNGKVGYYIPDRETDGYGLSLNRIENFKKDDVKLIITVDCGINACKEVDAINAENIDIIITDHHNPKEILPDAFAILNPKLEDCPYPYKDLAGVGVAYKLLIGLYMKLGLDSDKNINQFLDLVAVGTIADIVPLTGENRIFASSGLKRLRLRKNIGLSALINRSGLLNKKINTTDIVFGLAPRINAAGRMGSAMKAVELLISENDEESRKLAIEIEKQNRKRQDFDQQTYREACQAIERKYDDISKVNCIVIASDNWHPGVIGIVASKLVEKYYRPAIMLSFKNEKSEKNNVGIGSSRSIAGFDLFEALSQHDDMLESFGGHKYAAGLSIMREYIEPFEKRLNEYTGKHLCKDLLIPPLKVDRELEIYHINNNFLNWLQKFAPYGTKNMRPVFYTQRVSLAGYPYIVGRNHIKMKITKDGETLDMIGFNMGDYLPLLMQSYQNRRSNIRIAYTLELNNWQGKTNIQGKLKDIDFD